MTEYVALLRAVNVGGTLRNPLIFEHPYCERV